MREIREAATLPNSISRAASPVQKTFDMAGEYYTNVLLW